MRHSEYILNTKDRHSKVCHDRNKTINEEPKSKEYEKLFNRFYRRERSRMGENLRAAEAILNGGKND